ncbi:MAG: hypothetical protein MUF54_24490 [Polyangiaceae bacterium]|nr:hypothetical protein [Polyangiaceae bacterium]
MVKDVHADADPGVSREGCIAGTPQYMAPETHRAPDEVDARVDLYALGAVAYFLLTGKPVFEGASIVEICGHHLFTPPEPPSQRVGKPFPADLEQLVLDCLAKDPAQRPASAREVAGRALACADIHAWDFEAARRWWREHLPRVAAARRPPEQIASGLTVAVDLARDRDARLAP